MSDLTRRTRFFLLANVGIAKLDSTGNSVVTRYQLGFVLHAGSLMVPLIAAKPGELRSQP